MAAPVPVGPEPMHLNCPFCHANVTTTIQYKPSTKTHLIAVILCIFTCCICASIPYCLGSCKNKNHYCPACGAYLGTYSS